MKKTKYMLLLLIMLNFMWFSANADVVEFREEIIKLQNGDKLKISIPKYEDIGVKISEARMIDSENCLFLKGWIENRSNRILSGITVYAEIKDNSDNIISIVKKKVTPNILRPTRAKRGHFSMKTIYDKQALVNLDVVWAGKRSCDCITNVSCK